MKVDELIQRLHGKDGLYGYFEEKAVILLHKNL